MQLLPMHHPLRCIKVWKPFLKENNRSANTTLITDGCLFNLICTHTSVKVNKSVRNHFHGHTAAPQKYKYSLTRVMFAPKYHIIKAKQLKEKFFLNIKNKTFCGTHETIYSPSESMKEDLFFSSSLPHTQVIQSI